MGYGDLKFTVPFTKKLRISSLEQVTSILIVILREISLILEANSRNVPYDRPRLPFPNTFLIAIHDHYSFHSKLYIFCTWESVINTFHSMHEIYRMVSCLICLVMTNHWNKHASTTFQQLKLIIYGFKVQRCVTLEVCWNKKFRARTYVSYFTSNGPVCTVRLLMNSNFNYTI
jgi:hypothetical protein